MPSHLDILVGDYRRAIDANADACRADEKYVAEHGARNFYSFYIMHNYHSLVYAAMFAGQFKVALDAVNRMEASLPESLLRIESPPMADWLENFASVRVHVLVRFGRWQDLIALEMPSDTDLFCVTAAMIRYGKGVAYAATGDVVKAQEERDALVQAVECIPASRICGDFPNRYSRVKVSGAAGNPCIKSLLTKIGLTSCCKLELQCWTASLSTAKATTRRLSNTSRRQLNVMITSYTPSLGHGCNRHAMHMLPC